MENNSPKYSLNKTDAVKIAKGAEVALVGVLLTYFSSVIMATDFTIHYQNTTFALTPFIVMGWSVLYNAGKKWLSDNQK